MSFYLLIRFYQNIFYSRMFRTCSQIFQRDIAASLWTEATMWKLNSVTADETFFLYNFDTYERKFYNFDERRGKGDKLYLLFFIKKQFSIDQSSHRYYQISSSFLCLVSVE